MSNVEAGKDLLHEIEVFARTNKAPCNVVFGTSGWRGEIGSDYTFNNVKVVTSAIIEMFKSEDSAVMKALGVKDFHDIQTRGVVVGHDNRFLGPEFAKTVIGLLQAEHIRIYYCGETTTPEFSALVEELEAACSINLTPSHNPANWAGFKFNPADGGPAGSEITKVIEKYANAMMAQGKVIEDKPAHIYETVDPVVIYEKYIQKWGTLDINRIKTFIAEDDVFICVDHVHGASRSRPQRLLGESPKIRYFRTEDNYLFGGIAPEPSSKNMKIVTDALKASNSKYKLGVIIDPDGDRVRFTDGTVELPMNSFGALALHFLYKYKGVKGVLVKSVATSNFANAIAEKLGLNIKETMVGFKNFRPFMLRNSQERAIVAFEESDGISAYNHTLEKDAMFGFLLSIEMMATTGKNLGNYLKEVQDNFGYFYPDRAGIEVDRALVGKPLTDKLARIKEQLTAGAVVQFGNVAKRIKQVLTIDGTKVVFDDDSWMLIRPSGTEPKVRFYIETRSEAEKDVMFKKAEEITRQAIALRN
jgi:phosphomannomutase